MHDATGTNSTEVAILSDPSEARRLQDDIEFLLQQNGYTDHEIFSIKLAVEEALVNGMKHGNCNDPGKRLCVSYLVNPTRFDILIVDEGPGFNPNAVPDPTAAENLERPSGRGLMLMRYYMNEVIWNESGNSVRMCKLRNGTH